MAHNPWYVYIILTDKSRLYTGITTDIERRFNEHLNDSKKGAKYFRSQKPVKIVLVERYPDKSQASKREYYIKSLSRAEKLKLIKEKKGS